MPPLKAKAVDAIALCRTGPLMKLNTACSIIALLLICSLPCDLAAEGTVVGDKKPIDLLLALNKEAEALHPHGRLEATVRSENLEGLGEREVRIKAYWSGDRSRTECSYYHPGDPTEDFDAVVVLRGREMLRHSIPVRQIVLETLPLGRWAASDEIECMPGQCWFGGDGALRNRWSWYLDVASSNHDPGRQTSVVIEGDAARLKQEVVRDGEVVAKISAVFSLKLRGACMGYEVEVPGHATKSGALEWAQDNESRPVLKTLSWKVANSAGPARSLSLVVHEFDRGFVPAESLFNMDLSQFPLGTDGADLRSHPPRTFRTGDRDPLEWQRRLQDLGRELSNEGFADEGRNR